MQYTTRRTKITNWLKGVLDTLKAKNKETAEKSAMVANCAIETGSRESEVEEILGLFEKANIISIKDNKIWL